MLSSTGRYRYVRQDMGPRRWAKISGPKRIAFTLMRAPLEQLAQFSSLGTFLAGMSLRAHALNRMPSGLSGDSATAIEEAIEEVRATEWTDFFWLGDYYWTATMLDCVALLTLTPWLLKLLRLRRTLREVINTWWSSPRVKASAGIVLRSDCLVWFGVAQPAAHATEQSTDRGRIHNWPTD